MEGDVEDVGIGVEGLLGAVAMVNVLRTREKVNRVLRPKHALYPLLSPRLLEPRLITEAVRL